MMTLSGTRGRYTCRVPGSSKSLRRCVRPEAILHGRRKNVKKRTPTIVCRRIYNTLSYRTRIDNNARGLGSRDDFRPNVGKSNARTNPFCRFRFRDTCRANRPVARTGHAKTLVSIRSERGDRVVFRPRVYVTRRRFPQAPVRRARDIPHDRGRRFHLAGPAHAERTRPFWFVRVVSERVRCPRSVRQTRDRPQRLKSYGRAPHSPFVRVVIASSRSNFAKRNA